jgi:hypothetical protein
MVAVRAGSGCATPVDIEWFTTIPVWPDVETLS